MPVFRKTPARRRSWRLAASARKNYIMVGGQSRALGTSATPSLTTTQPYSNESCGDAGVPSLLVNSGAGLELPGPEIANNITFHARADGSDFQAVLNTHAASGAEYSVLKKGGTGPTYNQSITRLTGCHGNATHQPGGVRYIALCLLHGEADEQLSPNRDDYDLYLDEWRRDYDADGKGITSQTEPVLIFLDQASSRFGTVDPQTARVPYKVLGASEEFRRFSGLNQIFCVGPAYQYEYADGAHFINTSSRRCAEYFGKVMWRVLGRGELWRPLSIGSVRVQNTTEIIVSLRVPNKPIVFDTARVAAKANNGIEYADAAGGGAPTIQSVSIINELFASDNYQIMVKMSGAPRAGARIRAGFTEASGNSWAGSGFLAQDTGSPRTNIRDSDTTLSRVGNELFNWLCHSDAAIPGF